MTDPLTIAIVDFYTERYREDQRLQARPQGRLEWIRTVELLHELLPTRAARILDVGGGHPPIDADGPTKPAGC